MKNLAIHHVHLVRLMIARSIPFSELFYVVVSLGNVVSLFKEKINR